MAKCMSISCIWWIYTGTHWVCEIVQLIHANGNVADIDPLERPHPLEFEFPLNASWNRGSIPIYEATMSYKSPRTIYTHVPEDWMPQQIRDGKGKVSFWVLRQERNFWKLAEEHSRVRAQKCWISDWLSFPCYYSLVTLLVTMEQ